PIADVEIEFFGQISWLRVRCKIDDPQIWLRIGIYRLRDRGDEGELFAIRTERETAHVHVDRVELGRGAAVKADRIKLAPRLFVIRLVHVQRSEINLRTMFPPNGVDILQAPELH